MRRIITVLAVVTLSLAAASSADARPLARSCAGYILTASGAPAGMASAAGPSRAAPPNECCART